jgi:septal ring factor EnvC (AmiA/AmiB activator)
LEEIKELDHEMKLAVSDLHRMQDDARRRHGANSYLVEEMKEVENKISKAMNKVRRIEDDVYKFSAKA